jgi:hypothetical protein
LFKLIVKQLFLFSSLFSIWKLRLFSYFQLKSGKRIIHLIFKMVTNRWLSFKRPQITSFITTQYLNCKQIDVYDLGGLKVIDNMLTLCII